MRLYKVRTKAELAECDEFLATHGPLGGPPASVCETTWALRMTANSSLTGVVCAGLLDESRVGVIKNCAIHYDMRGHGLQVPMMNRAKAWAKRRGAVKTITHAHEENVASMVNLIKCGFIPYERVTGGFVYFTTALWTTTPL